MYLFDTIKKIILEGEISLLFKEVFLKTSEIEWRKKYKQFSKFYKRKQWFKAIKEGELILNTEQGDEDFFHKLAICYSKINRKDKSKIYMDKSLKLRINHSIDYIIDCVHKSSFSGKKNVKSQYTYIGGAANLGFISHEYIKGKEKYDYLTKIIPTNYPMDYFAYKEEYFHSVICKSYLELKTMAAEAVNCLKIKKERLFLITFNKVNNDKKDKSKLYDIINLNERISKVIEYNEVVKILKITDKGKAITLSSLMHKLSTHRVIFKRMNNKVSGIEPDYNLKKFISRAEYVIIDLKMYDYIKPEERYVFCHGDFDENNVLYDKENDTYHVIDWSSYRLGMRGHDLAKYFGSFKLTFKEVREVYLDSIENEIDSIDRMFFAYNFLIVCIKYLNRNKIDEEITERIIPTIEYMESLSENIK